MTRDEQLAKIRDNALTLRQELDRLAATHRDAETSRARDRAIQLYWQAHAALDHDPLDVFTEQHAARADADTIDWALELRCRDCGRALPCRHCEDAR